MKRRAFLNLTAAATATAIFPSAHATAASATPSTGRMGTWPCLVGAWKQGAIYYAGWWREDGGANGVEVPFRAHGVLVDPRDPVFAVAIARRPGEYIMRFRETNARETMVTGADAERVFEGHAAYSLDGAVIYTTESDTSNGHGIIGVRDAVTLTKQCELSTRGVGPHALLVEPQGSLLVANGGILTLPETGRTKLDTAHMDPSLVRIDVRDGRLLGQWRLADPQLGIRHLACGSDGIVGAALQAEHSDAISRESAPVLALFDGTSLRAVNAAPGSRLAGYGGDIACASIDGISYFAVGCTRANVIALWDADGHWRGVVPLRTACAIIARGEQLIAATEDGELACVSIDRMARCAERTSSLNWDNHVVIGEMNASSR